MTMQRLVLCLLLVLLSTILCGQAGAKPLPLDKAPSQTDIDGLPEEIPDQCEVLRSTVPGGLGVLREVEFGGQGVLQDHVSVIHVVSRAPILFPVEDNLSLVDERATQSCSFL